MKGGHKPTNKLICDYIYLGSYIEDQEYIYTIR